MTIYAVIGAKAAYLLFVWLLSAAIGSWVSERKGYGDRVGLAFGLILSAILIYMLVLVNDRRVMGRYVNGVVANLIGGATVLLLVVMTALLLLSVLPGSPLSG